MASFKVALFAAVLALAALQCQGAHVASPEIREAETAPEPRDLDLVLATQHAIKIVRNIVAAVDKGIKESKDSVDALVGQLTPEAGAAVKKVLDTLLSAVEKEKERIEFVIKEVQQLLDALTKIKSCTDPEKKDIEKAVGNLENGLLKVVQGAIAKNAEKIKELRASARALLTAFRKLVDDEIAALIGCIKPGNPNAEKCIVGEIEKIKKQIVSLGFKGTLVAQQAVEVGKKVAQEIIANAKPAIENFQKEAGPILKKVSDCIAKMK